MAEPTNGGISLPPELEAFVASRVASGRYRSVSEVVGAGLRLLEDREREEDEALAEMRQKIAVGLAQAERGELLDGEDVFRQLEERERLWHAENERDSSA